MDSGQAIGLRLARREESALEDAYAAYGPSLLAYLRRYVGPDEAEDVLQRTFLDVWRHSSRYQPAQRFSTWLFTIAHRRAVDTLRARRHRVVVDVEAARDLVGEDGRETAERYAEAAEVRAALARLPEHEREALELTYYAGLTQREIAAHLDVPIGTVKARTSRATRRLGALMRDGLREGGAA
jgi:RNA polymerase sigma factor (sigma-70 family)